MSTSCRSVGLYLGLFGTLAAVRLFNVIFGGVYFLLGVAGLLLGSSGTATVGHLGEDSRLFKLIPGVLELGIVDHVFHLIAGVVLVAAGIAGFMATARHVRSEL